MSPVNLDDDIVHSQLLFRPRADQRRHSDTTTAAARYVRDTDAGKGVTDGAAALDCLGNSDGHATGQNDAQTSHPAHRPRVDANNTTVGAKHRSAAAPRRHHRIDEEIIHETVGGDRAVRYFAPGRKNTIRTLRFRLGALFQQRRAMPVEVFPSAKAWNQHVAVQAGRRSIQASSIARVGSEKLKTMKSRTDALLRRLRQLCAEAKVPAVVPHSLRGLHATLASGFGATSHAVAAALGHTTFVVTARHYVDRDILEQARSRRSREVLSGNCHPESVTAGAKTA
jgi:hypothetical protein